MGGYDYEENVQSNDKNHRSNRPWRGAVCVAVYVCEGADRYPRNRSIQTAYGLGAFFAALFGPIAGGLIAFIGHALSDALQYGSPWWSWVIASGVSMFLVGLVYPKMKVEEGEFGWKDLLRFNIYQILANVIAWGVVAPVLDIVIYAEPVAKVFTQGIVAGAWNMVSAGVIGSLLLFAYSKTRSKKGSLQKEE